ncbi:MAG: VWA domain-containing protein, partial [Clostridiales bacterium]|nr:VWA domain-containing protein [Clostridiales bacterium]
MKKVLALVLSLMIVLSMVPNVVFGAAGSPPAHQKIRRDNPDGTYTIALNVKGEAEKKAQKINVIVIVDTSGSMSFPADDSGRTTANNTTIGHYGNISNSYRRLYYRSGGTYYPEGTGPEATQRHGTVYQHSGDNWQTYTGTRYNFTNNDSRMESTQVAVNSLASSLLAKNSSTTPDAVEMALVTFASGSNTAISKTTSYDTFSNAVNGLIAYGATNWESALRTANGVSFGDDNQTFVIFFSDGAPTMYGTNSGNGQEQTANMNASYNAAVDDAQTLANKVTPDNFYTIFAFGEDFGATYMTNITAAAGAPESNNYSASDTTGLQAAFDEILNKIEMAGFQDVAMEDGTTSNVSTSSGSSQLLVIDENSYKYYRAGGYNEDGTTKYNPSANTMTVGDTTVNLGVEWQSTDNPAPPAAKLDENGSVIWDLSELGLLENEVTYTVTFKCYPSQTTLDYVAAIKNDPSFWNTLDPEEQKYIDKNGNLMTNTSASLSWEDTREGGGHGPTAFNDLPAVTTTAVEQLTVAKAWENDLDQQEAEEVVITLLRDEEEFSTFTLGEKSGSGDDAPRDWDESFYIAVGIIDED